MTTTTTPQTSADPHHGHNHAPGEACGGCGHDHHAAAPFDTSALISARGVYLSRNGRAVLDHVDIDIRPKEIVTLIGPNGSGKTTLVRVLLGLVTPGHGRVSRAKGLRTGYVPQRFDIDRAIPMTVERFLALGNGGRVGQISELLRETGVPTIANQQLAQLSGGELQRVLLARALLCDPQLLVLDEPARGVDHIGEADLYALIARLRDARGFGVLLISHDLHIVMASSDRVICLNGHVCCSGVPETVSKHPEYVRLFGAEAARALAVYQHHHDHRHDLGGTPLRDHGGTR
jgi:zinc transport system ATP-binding protein